MLLLLLLPIWGSSPPCKQALRYSPLECNSCQNRQHLTNFKKSWNNGDEVSNRQFHFLGDVFAADVVVFAYKLPIASSLTACGSEKRRTTQSPSLGETLFLGVSFSRFQKTIMKKVITLSTTATLETEESGHCSSREVLNKSQCMEFLSAGTKNSGRRKVEKWP